LEVFVKLFTTKALPPKMILLLLAALPILSCKTDVKEITIRARSRMYVDFAEEHTVKMYEKFSIGDTDMEGVIVEFYPDFAIDTLTHKAITLSDTLKNPAAKILVIEDNRKKEEAWAFRPGLMPHFSPRSFIGFELVDFKTGGNYILPANSQKRDEQ
jgi:hypothetical protein